MEVKTTKTVKFLSIIFILLTIIHVLYATYSMRGLYLDDLFLMTKMLDNISLGSFVICNDFELIADVVFSNVSKQEFNENDVVVVLSDTGVEMGKETKKVHIPFAKIELLKMQW